MSYEVAYQATIEVLTCCTCGIAYGMPGWFVKKRREDGENFYCPNGHSQVFGNSEVDRLRKQLTASQARLDQMAADRDEKERQLRAQRGVATRFKNRLHRVGRGVCPCCDKEFKDLKSHIESEHPSFTAELESEGEKTNAK